MKVKRIGEKIQAIIDPGEALRMSIINPSDPENQYMYRTVVEALKGTVWRLMQAHALEKLNGMAIGWGAVDYIDGNFVVTFGPEKLSPHTLEVPGEKK